jgi:hypothetical protein
MVRNWQARVEKAAVRRKQAKQHKQTIEEKKVWKQWIQECFKEQLDANVAQFQALSSVPSTSCVNSIGSTDQQRQLCIHIWVDTKPRSNRCIGKDAMSSDVNLESDEDGAVTPRGSMIANTTPRSRSSSNSDTISNSKKTSNSKKKVHPRSKDATVAAKDDPNKSFNPKEDNIDDDNEDDLDDDDVCMCRSYFYTGKCDLFKPTTNGGSGGKKHANTCRHVHPGPNHNPSTNRTLYQVLQVHPARSMRKGNDVTNHPAEEEKQQLYQSARAEMMAAERTAMGNQPMTAATTATTTTTTALSSPTNNVTSGNNSSNPISGATTAFVNPIVAVGAMNMLYYFDVPLLLGGLNNRDNDDGIEEMIILPGEQISQILRQQNIFLSNIVYMAVNGKLIYDRFQEGRMFHNNQEFLHAIFGEKAMSNVLQYKRDRCLTHPDDVALVMNFPATILGTICLYLDDVSIVSMIQACRTWYNEIGQPNAPIWRTLLNRRKWPCEDCTDPSHTTSNVHSYRSQFYSHYCMMRDMLALKSAYDFFIRNPNNTTSTALLSKTNVAIYDYASRQNAPVGPCQGIEVWSPRHVLVAYRRDCTLRLYESSHKLAAGGIVSNETSCRELICYRVDPYRNTKRKLCSINHLVLDEKYVNTLCEVKSTQSPADTEILLTISRDDFLIGESGVNIGSDAIYNKSTSLQVFNLTDEIRQYMNHSADRPQHWPELLRDERNDLTARFYTVTDTVSSCGSGIIMIATSIFLQGNEEVDEERILLEARLFLISTTRQHILWSNSCDPLLVRSERNPIQVYDHLCTSSIYLRTQCDERSSTRGVYNFAVASRLGENKTILLGDVDLTGTVSALIVVSAGTSKWPTVTLEGGQWLKDPLHERQLLCAHDDMITADVWYRREDDGSVESTSSIITFYPKSCSTVSMDDSKKDVAPDLSFLEMSNLTVQHISYIRDRYLVMFCEQFSAIDNFLDVEMAISVIIHIPTRQEIGRCNWIDYRQDIDALPRLVSCGHETLGLEMSRERLIMTGNDVRYRNASTCTGKMNGIGNQDVAMGIQQLEQSTKKKKKKAARSKKDSFRTHNGDRCY